MVNDPTIDAIDHALDDWATSDDAMRWTTAEVKPSPAVVILNIDPEPFLRALQRAARAVAKLVEAFSPALRLMAGWEQQETTLRRARVHTAYRHRQLARRRRNRRRR